MSDENLEAPNPFNQSQHLESNDSLNFESNFWKEENQGAYDEATFSNNKGNAYDDDVQQRVEQEHKSNAITSLFNNMKQKLNENINKPSNNNQSNDTSNGVYGDDKAYGAPYDKSTEPTQPSKKEDKSANLLSANQISMSHEELDKKEAYLDKREKQLLERKKRLQAVKHELTSSNIRRDNWPCSYYPITFHSIQQEIPPHARSHMKRMYILVLLTFLCFVSNTFAELVLYFSDVGSDWDILLAVLYLFCGVCSSWRFWYRQIYYAIRDRKTVKWWVFFLFFALHIVFCTLMTIGFNTIGGAGIIAMINAFQKKKNFGGFVCLICACLWCIVTFGSVYYLKKSWVIFKERGGVEETRGAITVARHAADQLV